MLPGDRTAGQGGLNRLFNFVYFPSCVMTDFLGGHLAELQQLAQVFGLAGEIHAASGIRSLRRACSAQRSV